MRKKILTTILFGLFFVSAASIVLFAAKPDNPGKGRKPDKNKPVHATDIELVKKQTVRGKPPWAGGGKPKKGEGAATGVLGASVQGDRYAVVVGISDYPGTDNDLNYSDDDAEEMRNALTSVYGFSSGNVTILTNLGATRSAILEAIDDMPVDAGEIVFFFSGHGMKGKAEDGDNEKIDEAIVTHDGAELVPIWDGELREALAGFGRAVLVFDICLAGGMKKDLDASERVIAMASNERGLSYEGSFWENGEFTYYFVGKGILQGEAHVSDYDGTTVEEAYDYAKANCAYDDPTIGDSFEADLLP